MEYGLNECAGVMTRGRMHDEPGGFVDHEEMFVFEEHFKGNVLWNEVGNGRWR